MRDCGTCLHFNGKSWCDKNKMHTKKINVCADWDGKEMTIDQAVETILSLFEPNVKKEFEIAAHELGLSLPLYIAGLLNYLYLIPDYYNPDVDQGWLEGNKPKIKDLFCQYSKCGKKIEKPQHVNQIFCCNECAKWGVKERKPGVVHPVPTERETEEQTDLKAYKKEEERLNAYR